MDYSTKKKYLTALLKEKNVDKKCGNIFFCFINNK